MSAAAPQADEGIELTESLIKYASGQFDVSMAHTSILTMLSIRSIAPTAFVNCSTYLTSLDLSRNQLTSLDGIQHLTALQVLDVSMNNGISDLSPLQKCTALQVLHAESNGVKDLNAMSRALDRAYLPTLRALYLQRRDGSDANPVCSDRKAYLVCIEKNFSHLRCLDGHYFNKTDMNPIYVDVGGDREIQLPQVERWIGNDYFGRVLLEGEKVGVIPEKAFTSQVTECKRVLTSVKSS